MISNNYFKQQLQGLFLEQFRKNSGGVRLNNNSGATFRAGYRRRTHRLQHRRNRIGRAGIHRGAGGLEPKGQFPEKKRSVDMFQQPPNNRRHIVFFVLLDDLNNSGTILLNNSGTVLLNYLNNISAAPKNSRDHRRRALGGSPPHISHELFS